MHYTKKILFIFTTIAVLSSCKSQHQESETFPYPFLNYHLSMNQRIDDLVSRLTIEEKISWLMLSNPPIPRLGIKAFQFGGECLHGIARSGRATVFPQNIGLGATFDEELIFRMATVISDEARAKYRAIDSLNDHQFITGITYFSPNINIFRDPRWGRGQETYGEDPYLTSKLGVAFVRGIQGDNKNYLKTAGCAKHFFAHSGPEDGRALVHNNPSKKDLNETYLPAFKALIQEADVQMIMAAYHFINDTPAAANPYVLKTILRDQLGFKHMVTSDGGAIELMNGIQKFTRTPEESALAAFKAGIDLNLGDAYKKLIDLYQQKKISEKDIDVSLRRGLEIKFKLGVFDPSEMNVYNKIPTSILNSEEHKKLALEVAQKSIVLLKNNHVLPLNKNLKKLYIVGNMAANIDVLLGNYNGLSGDMPSVLSAIISKINPGTIAEYRPGVMLDEPSKSKADWTDPAHQCDAIIAVMGISNLIEGEEGESIASEAQGDRPDLGLPKNQVAYFKKLRSYGKKPIILVLTGGSPIIDPEIYELADAVLFAWYPGEQGGNAITDIIFGDVSPSGKLPITFPASVEQLPAFNDYSMVNRTYRYMKEEPLFPFGYGLTYSSFDISEITLNKKEFERKDTSLLVSVKVTNTGKVVSDEIVQLYISAIDQTFRTPLYSLKGFKRIHLNPGENVKAEFNLLKKDVMIVNDEGLEALYPGKYKITIGFCSPGKRSEKLNQTKFEVADFSIQ